MILLWLMAATWEAPRVPAGAPPPAGLGDMTAATCGACHTEIYAEWQSSVHAAAWVDPQFQGELSKDPEVAWVCINCHTPAGDQQVEISVATGDVRAPERSMNPDFSEAFQQEGLTCVTCHYRDGAVLGPYGDSDAPHAVTLEPRLRSSELCMDCHQAVARVEDTLVCSFNTGVEWQESGSTDTCQSCHMPQVDRPLVAGGPERSTRRHWFLGSGIAKGPQSDEHAALYAQAPVGIAGTLDAPGSAAVGELVSARLDVENVAGAHAVPTGDPERYLWVELQAVDAQGRVIAQATHRIGQRWRWWPTAERLADNRLGPGEQRSVPLRFVQPEGGVRLVARVTHYRISPENAQYHGLNDYPTHRVMVELEQAVDAPR